MERTLGSFFKQNILIVLLLVCGVGFLIVGMFQLVARNSSSITITDTVSESPSLSPHQASIVIDVSGAVKNPGVYSLKNTDRVKDALIRAGGLAEDADTEYVAKVINQAQILTDGQKIFIPYKGHEISLLGATTNQAEKVNINTASTTVLEELPGIGPVTAQKIIDNRPYTKIEEVKEKNVVSSSVFEKIKESISTY